jgi:hypothetical protein
LAASLSDGVQDIPYRIVVPADSFISFTTSLQPFTTKEGKGEKKKRKV